MSNFDVLDNVELRVGISHWALRRLQSLASCVIVGFFLCTTGAIYAEHTGFRLLNRELQVAEGLAYTVRVSDFGTPGTLVYRYYFGSDPIPGQFINPILQKCCFDIETIMFEPGDGAMLGHALWVIPLCVFLFFCDFRLMPYIPKGKRLPNVAECNRDLS